MKYRLHAWASGFDNLVLAGDWIYTGFNVGSFEGAVMSGKLASLTLTGRTGARRGARLLDSCTRTQPGRPAPASGPPEGNPSGPTRPRTG